MMRQSEANLDNLKSNRRTILISSLDVALEVDIQELEHEVQLLVGVNDVEQSLLGSWSARSDRAKQRTHLTMLSSFNSLSKLISRIAVLGTPSSSASSLIFFRATI